MPLQKDGLSVPEENQLIQCPRGDQTLPSWRNLKSKERGKKQKEDTQYKD